MSNDPTRPHSPYVGERDTLDNGFSRDWGLHFTPSEEYWVDVHNHLRKIAYKEQIPRLLDQWFARLDGYRLGQALMLTDQSELFDAFESLAASDPRFGWLYWPDTQAPDIGLIERAAKQGSLGYKLHNHSIMRGGVPRDVWFSDDWAHAFAFAQEAGLPLLWHVTQRLSYSPYHGGGRNAYWAQGWEKGVDFTNEDLLQDVLRIMREYPRLKVVGAHQLHIGIDRLSELFDEYENLYIDSSCGFYLRWADDFLEEDRVRLRDFVEKYASRIVFGTDSDLQPRGIDEYLVQGFLCHARFFLRLGLSDDALQAVAWRTAQGLFQLAPVSSARRGNVRP